MKAVKGIWLPESDTHFPKHLNADGSYQKDIFDAAMQCVNNPAIFYDIGAHVGTWSRMALNCGFKQIHAFEPNKKTFDCLRKNFEEKECDIQFYNYGVAQIKNIWMKIEEVEGNSGAVRLINNQEGREHLLSNAAVAPISDNFTLHEQIAKFDIKPHDCLVKIDTEGMEASCVLGMDKIIYALRPVVCVEQRSNMDALDILEKMGMRIAKQVRKDYILIWKDL